MLMVKIVREVREGVGRIAGSLRVAHLSTWRLACSGTDLPYSKAPLSMSLGFCRWSRKETNPALQVAKARAMAFTVEGGKKLGEAGMDKLNYMKSLACKVKNNTP